MLEKRAIKLYVTGWKRIGCLIRHGSASPQQSDGATGREWLCDDSTTVYANSDATRCALEPIPLVPSNACSRRFRLVRLRTIHRAVI